MGNFQAVLRHFDPDLSKTKAPLMLLESGVRAAVRTGDAKRAQQLLAEMSRVADTSNHAYPVALAQIAVGDHEAALDLLEKSYERRTFRLPEISIDVRVDPLRGKERFERLLRKMGLVNAWRKR